MKLHQSVFYSTHPADHTFDGPSAGTSEKYQNFTSRLHNQDGPPIRIQPNRSGQNLYFKLVYISNRSIIGCPCLTASQKALS